MQIVFERCTISVYAYCANRDLIPTQVPQVKLRRKYTGTGKMKSMCTRQHIYMQSRQTRFKIPGPLWSGSAGQGGSESLASLSLDCVS